MNAIKAHRLLYKLRMYASFAYSGLERFIEGEPDEKDAEKLSARIEKDLTKIEELTRRIREEWTKERGIFAEMDHEGPRYIDDAE